MKTPNMDKSKEESVVLLSVSKPMENNNTLENGDFHPFEYDEKKMDVKNGQLKSSDIEKTLDNEGAKIKRKSKVPLVVAWVCVGCAITFVSIAVIAVVVILTRVAGTPKPPVPFNQTTTVSPSTVSVSTSSSSIQPTPSSTLRPSSTVTTPPVSQTISTLQTSSSSTLSPSVSPTSSLSSVSPRVSSTVSSSNSVSSTKTPTVSVTSSSTVTSASVSPTKSTVISTSLSTNSVTTASVTVEFTTPKPVCNATQFQCLDGSCIDRLYVCDGLPTCPSAEDEDENCVCSEDQFRCASGQCIPKNLTCDGVTQCFDLSDEVKCSNCQGFQCNSGLCLWAHSFKCNDRVDCPDLSDEMSCPWRPGYGECDNGLFVPWSQWCDGIDDCFDNTDEEDCDGECHLLGEKLCPDMKTCVVHEWWCDGHFDCPGGMDEVNCRSCSEHEWQCSDHSCISQDAVCNGVIDCPSRDDESSCLELKDSGNLQQTSGLVLVKSHDQQLPICSSDWSHDLTDHVCQYLGFESSTGYTTVVDSASQAYMAVDSSRPTTSLSTNQTVLAALKQVPSCSTNKVISVSCIPKVCGERKVSLLTQFIVGGTLSPLGKWPWMVSISFLGKDICGGVLVGNRWVLTAAHCIVSGSFNYTMLPFNFEVTAGTVYRKRSVDNDNDIHRQMFKVDKIIVNPNTVKLVTGVMDWDMALLQLNKPVVYEDYVQPVCLPDQDESFPTKSQCYLAGWGFINTQQATVNELREAKMRLWGEEDCGRNTVNGESHVNTNSTLCAGYSTGLVSACQGDSGGPLMCADTRGHWTVAGVMSSGSQGCDGMQFNQANRFAKVSAASSWIHSVILPS